VQRGGEPDARSRAANGGTDANWEEMQRLSSCRKTHIAVLITCQVMRVRRDGRRIGLRLADIVSSWSTAGCSTGRNIKREPVNPTYLFPEKATQIWAAFLLFSSSDGHLRLNADNALHADPHIGLAQIGLEF
jgi:hypothetical protein